MSRDRGACILVFGVSGVGKSSACEAFCGRRPQWLHFKASSLLSDATGDDPETLRTSPSNSIRSNQDLLCEALERARSGQETRPVLLDAHGVIDNGRDLVPVPTQAVARLRPDGIILLEAGPAEVAYRRAHGLRQRPTRSDEELTSELRMERETVQNYATVLRLPLVCGTTTTEFTLDPLVDSVLESIRAP